MARPKVEKEIEVAFYVDSEKEVREEAKSKGFNGVEYIIIGDDMYYTGKATVLNGKVIRWGLFDEEGEMVGNCGSYEDVILALKGKDVNEYYGNEW